MRRATQQLLSVTLALAVLLVAASPNLHAQTNGDLGYAIANIDPDNGQLYLDERAGTVSVTVTRQANFNAPSTVHYRVGTNSPSMGSGLATAGVDFLPTEGTLSFGATETNKSFTVTLLDDDLSEGDEDFFIVLDQATGGVPIHTPEIRAIIRDGERNLVRVDPEFGPEWSLGTDAVGAFALAVQPADGKILLVTPADRVNGETGTLVLRLLADGQRDPAWQTAAINAWANFLVLQPNGQVLIGVSDKSRQYEATSPTFVVNGVTRSHLARLNTDGSLDTAFLAQLPTNTIVTGLAVQSNGLIFAAVRTLGTTKHVLCRLDATGSLDAAFKPPTLADFYSPLIQPTPDGGILFVNGNGWMPRGGRLRFNADGSPDDTFEPPTDCVLEALQPDGRLLVIVTTNDVDSRLTRLTASGQLDPTFTTVNLDATFATRVLPTAQGKIWILNESFGFARDRWTDRYLRRIDADGSADSTWAVAQFMEEFNVLLAGKLLELPDGNLLLAERVAGLANGHLRAGLVRLLVNAPLPRFEVDPASARVPENGGKIPIQIVRCGTNTQPVTVTWQTEGGTAKPGVDYVPASGTLSFPANESVATLELEVLDNAVPDKDRTVRLRLQRPPPESREYPPVEITIANDDLGFPPGCIRRFPNGRVLLQPARVFAPGGIYETYAYIESSENLGGWTECDADGNYPITFTLASPEFIDQGAPTNAVRFLPAAQGVAVNAQKFDPFSAPRSASMGGCWRRPMPGASARRRRSCAPLSNKPGGDPTARPWSPPVRRAGSPEPGRGAAFLKIFRTSRPRFPLYSLEARRAPREDGNRRRKQQTCSPTPCRH